MHSNVIIICISFQYILFELLYRFFCIFPDEFIFTQRATIKELAIIVKLGELSDIQKQYLSEGQVENEEGQTTVIDESLRKQPLCPWFTCCY
jgi:hypothetical protein